MPIYRLEDTATGRWLRVEADSPPTEDEAAELFSRTPAPGVVGFSPVEAPQPTWTPPSMPVTSLQDFPVLPSTNLVEVPTVNPGILRPSPGLVIADLLAGNPATSYERGGPWTYAGAVMEETARPPIGISQFVRGEQGDVALSPLVVPEEQEFGPRYIALPYLPGLATGISALPKGKLKETLAGVYNIPVGLANFLGSPQGILSALLTKQVPVTRYPVGGYYGTQMAASAPESIASGVTAFQEGRPFEGVQEVAGGLGGLALAGGIFSHLTQPGKVYDTQSQQRLQSDVPQGTQSRGSVPQQTSGTAETPTGGVLQTPSVLESEAPLTPNVRGGFVSTLPPETLGWPRLVDNLRNIFQVQTSGKLVQLVAKPVATEPSSPSMVREGQEPPPSSPANVSDLPTPTPPEPPTKSAAELNKARHDLNNVLVVISGMAKLMGRNDLAQRAAEVLRDAIATSDYDTAFKRAAELRATIDELKATSAQPKDKSPPSSVQELDTTASPVTWEDTIHRYGIGGGATAGDVLRRLAATADPRTQEVATRLLAQFGDALEKKKVFLEESPFLGDEGYGVNAIFLDVGGKGKNRPPVQHILYETLRQAVDDLVQAPKNEKQELLASQLVEFTKQVWQQLPDNVRKFLDDIRDLAKNPTEENLRQIEALAEKHGGEDVLGPHVASLLSPGDLVANFLLAPAEQSPLLKVPYKGSTAHAELAKIVGEPIASPTTPGGPPLPPNDIPVTVRRPDGTTYQAGFNGYQPTKIKKGPGGEPVYSDYVPVLSVLKEGATEWTTGVPLKEGETIVAGKIPPPPKGARTSGKAPPEVAREATPPGAPIVSDPVTGSLTARFPSDQLYPVHKMLDWVRRSFPDTYAQLQKSGVLPEIENLKLRPATLGAIIRRYTGNKERQTLPPNMTLDDVPPEWQQAITTLDIHEGARLSDVLRRATNALDLVGKENAAVADFLLRHFEPELNSVRVSHEAAPGTTRPGGGPSGVFLDTLNSGYFFDPAFLLLHEAIHAVTLKAIDNPRALQQWKARHHLEQLRQYTLSKLAENERAFVAEAQSLLSERTELFHPELSELMSRHGVTEERLNLYYALMNVHEFTAGALGDGNVRSYLKTLSSPKGSVFQQVKDAVKAVLGIPKDTVLDSTVDAIIELRERPVETGGLVEATQLSLPFLPPPPSAIAQALAAYRDVRATLPDLPSKDRAKQIHTIKWATERWPVLGRPVELSIFGRKTTVPSLLGGKGRISTPQDEAIAVWYAERYGVGPAIASAFGERIRGKLDRVFGVSETGDLNVGTKNLAQSLKMADVFEALYKDPDAYVLTPEQRAAFNNIVLPVIRQSQRLIKKYHLVDVLDEHGSLSAYFPRIVISLARGEPTGGRGRVGAKQSFQKKAIFETEQEGWDFGVIYEPSIEARLVKYVERVYRAIADKRLADDPALKWRSRSQVIQELKLALPDLTDERIARIASSIQTKGTVNSPAFFGRIFSPETAELLNREFAAENSRVRNVLASTNSLLKGLRLGFDWGVGQIQLLPTLYISPAVWAEAQTRAFVAFVETLAGEKGADAWNVYANRNMKYLQELAQYGSSIGRLEEYMRGLGKEQPLVRIPRTLGRKVSKLPYGDILRVPFEAAARTSEAFGRHFQVALDVAKVEYWKAWRDLVPVSERPRLARAIETVLMSGRMESAMVPHGRALLERTALLAPAYYRGALDFIAALSEGGKTGELMARSMGAFITGTVFTYAAFAYANGMSKEEIKKRLNPLNTSKFLMWDVKVGDETYHIGIGGIFLSLLRLAGDTLATSIKHPENWLSLSPDKNPLSRWYRGHIGPIGGHVWSLFSGRDFLGRRTNLKTELLQTAPLAISQEGGVLDKALGLVGVEAKKARPPTAEEAAEHEGRPLSTMSFPERLRFGRRYDKEQQPLSSEETMLARQRAAEAAFERGKNLLGSLPRDLRRFVEDNQLTLPSFDLRLEQSKVRIPMTSEEREDFEKLFQKWHVVELRKLSQRPDWGRLTPARRQALLERYMSRARDAARDEMRMRLKRAGRF